MLYRAHYPHNGCYCLEIQCCELGPPAFFDDTPETYRAHLRALYKSNPRPFLALIRDARQDGFDILDGGRPDLADVLYEALVAVAATKGWNMAGGMKAGEHVKRQVVELLVASATVHTEGTGKNKRGMVSVAYTFAPTERVVLPTTNRYSTTTSSLP